MTLLEEILSKCSQEVLDGRNPQEIADVVNVDRIKVIEFTLGGKGLVLRVLGRNAGSAFLDTLTAMAAVATGDNRSVFYGLELLAMGQLDFGNKDTREMIDQLMPPEAATKMKAVAERPDPITEFDVRCTLWDVDGNWLGG